MDHETENNAIIRARADFADLDRKIAITKAEEERLAADRHRWEVERGQVSSFIEMYQKYAGGPSAEVSDNDGCEQSQTKKPTSNGASHVIGAIDPDKGLVRNSRKRRPPVHRKPPATPTTHEMILAALKDAESRGASGLAPKDIANFIRQKWWPHLKSSSVGPAAWRMYQEKQILKDGGLYVLPHA